VSALLEVTDLRKHFTKKALLQAPEVLRAVDDVSFEMAAGETLGVVGESGSGKSTLGRVILGLLKPTTGKVMFEGRDVHALSGTDAVALRRSMQVVFQDPLSALNPRMTIGDAIMEPLVAHGLASGAEAKRKTSEMLERVGLSAEHALRYPHEISGGQRQRAVIARALSLKPKFLVCDEPVAALDVSVQAQILNLLKDLQRDFDLSLLFIAHDLSVVRFMSQRIAVMYLGRIVEIADAETLYTAPKHPYTQALLSAIPSFDATKREARVTLLGEPPSPLSPPSGCTFHPRCARFDKGRCDVDVPLLRLVGAGHQAACHWADEG
jgi:oligopeptide/dipeptide ABC transporter ATP-binding protein